MASFVFQLLQEADLGFGVLDTAMVENGKKPSAG